MVNFLGYRCDDDADRETEKDQLRRLKLSIQLAVDFTSMLLILITIVYFYTSLKHLKKPCYIKFGIFFMFICYVCAAAWRTM